MTFERWAKELLCKELKSQGTTYYIKKSIVNQGWYCLTPTGFLLHVYADKQRFGNFEIKYEIMPLIGRITELSADFPIPKAYKIPVAMGVGYDVRFLYKRKFCHKKLISLRSADIELPQTYENAKKMICDYLNPLFDSLNSYENYCKATIEIELYTSERDERKRKHMAQLLFDRGIEAGINRENHCPEEYPEYYPWYASYTTAMPYVYAALGKYEVALAHIRAIREVRMQVLTNAYKRGDYAKNPDMFLKKMEELKRDDNEIEMAMQANDAELVKQILENNYRRNQELIRESLGIEIPENCPIL